MFHILRRMGFLMIPLTTLYNDYIDRPNLSEQKKPFVYYIVPPPLKWVGTKNQKDQALFILDMGRG